MEDTPLKSNDTQIPKPFPPGSIQILGAGRFGVIAANRLSRRFPQAQFLLVDSREERLEEVKRTLKMDVLQLDVADYLQKTSVEDDVWIIPAVPVHVAFIWMMTRLGVAVRSLPVPDDVDAQVPNPYRVPSSGTLYAGFATFICPDVCNEPDEICTYTGEARQGNLFDRLSAIRVSGFDVIVVRSWQLAPGVGGYPFRSLLDGLRKIADKGNYLIATACRCHGVVDAFRRGQPLTSDMKLSNLV